MTKYKYVRAVSVVVYSLFLVAPTELSSFCNHLAGEETVGCYIVLPF